jgi:hypothetical protein
VNDPTVRRSLEQQLIRISSHTGSCLNHGELLTVAAPFCSPLLELVRDDLRETLTAVHEAEALERQLITILAGPTLPFSISSDQDQAL